MTINLSKTTNFKGMSQADIKQHVVNLYNEFRATFSKPLLLVNMSEVRGAFNQLKCDYENLRYLISEEKTYWFAYQAHNSAFRDWDNVLNEINTIMSEAWENAEGVDWDAVGGW